LRSKPKTKARPKAKGTIVFVLELSLRTKTALEDLISTTLCVFRLWTTWGSMTACQKKTFVLSLRRQTVLSRASQPMRFTADRLSGRLILMSAFSSTTCRHLTAIDIRVCTFWSVYSQNW